MKIAEILSEGVDRLDEEIRLLLELTEKMPRGEYYGCWVDSNTKEIHNVEHQQHTRFIKRWAVENHDVDPMSVNVGQSELYRFGYMHGLVRVEYEDPTSISIDGTTQALKKASQILLATCVQPDINYIYIDKRDTPNGPSSSKFFQMPSQRRELMMYIKDEYE